MILHYNIAVLLDSLHYTKSSLILVFSGNFAVPCAPSSILGGPCGTGSDGVRFQVHDGWDSRNVSVAGVCDCVKECVNI